MNYDFVITATKSMTGYATMVVEQVKKYPSFSSMVEKIDCVHCLETLRFADGEMEVAINQSIRGKDVFLFASCARNPANIGVDMAKIELYNTVDALKRSQANRIIVFEPYISCSRSDRTTRRNSVGLWVHLKTLTSLGAGHIITYQLHSDKSKSMVDPVICNMDDVPALTLLKRRLCDAYIHDEETLENVVRESWAFCSVDAGGETLARRFANSFGAKLVVAHKQRDYSRVNTVESINILTADPLKGKIIWIVDDMVDTGGSVESLINALVQRSDRPNEINLAVVHPVLSYPAIDKLRALHEKGFLNRFIVTDTVNCSEDIQKALPNLEIVPSVELSAQIILTIVTGGAMSMLLDVFDAKNYLNKAMLL